MANNIQKSINDAISTIVSKRIDALALDKTVIGIIDSYVDTRRGIYKIKCDGGYFNARSQSEGVLYLPGMSVYVQIPQNDMTKEKLIISRANVLREETYADVTVSAINNFSIIGTNLLQNVNTIESSGLGIRSYHDPTEENENTISHRVRSLFGQDYYYELLDEDIFNLYRKDATALMVEADFRTALGEDQRRQTAGVYGIGLDLKFKNANFSIGETQGEIFNYYANLVQGAITIIDDNGQYVPAAVDNEGHAQSQKVIVYSSQLEQELNNDDISVAALRDDGGLLDKYKSYISSIITVFETSGETKDIDNSWLTSMNAYLSLLNDLKYINLEEIYTDITPSLSDKEKIVKYYEEWFNTEVASPEFNNVAFVLDSNNMTGNPYNYSSWSTQYAIFSIDMETFAGINDILFYKDGFLLDENKCTHDNTGREVPREDLFIKNVKVYALKPISAENGDYRLEISSPNGLVFNSISEDEILQSVAKVTKAYYQNLTDQCTFYWFKKNRNVTTVSSTDYHQFGGIGWAYLTNKRNGRTAVLTGAENQAYENVYKCVAVIDGQTILSQEFYVYNLFVKTKLKIFSDLGVKFSFDSGTPLLTCWINDKEPEKTEEENYHYYWAVVVNGQRTFLNEKIKVPEKDIKITDIIGMLSFDSLTKGMKFYDHEEELTENFELATRVLYPIGNIGLEKIITFECYVEQKFNNNYIDIGCATLTLSNDINAAVSDYHIVIENGNQVFQYDEYGNSPTAKKLKDPLQIKPLICHFFNPTGLEIPNGNYTLNWIIPMNDSMLIPKNTDRLVENPATKLREIDNTSTELVFDIAEFYNEEYQNNQVTCQIVFNGETISKDTNLLFTKVGENGTNGTDIVARIIPKNIRWIGDSLANGNTILDKEPLTLYSSSNGTRLTLNNGKTSFNQSGLHQFELVPSSLSAHLYLKNEEIPSTNIKTVWNVAGSTQTTQNNNGKYIRVENTADISGFINSKVIWNTESDSANKPFENYILKVKMEYGEKYSKTSDKIPSNSKNYYTKNDNNTYSRADVSKGFDADTLYYEKSVKEYYAFYPLCIIKYIEDLPTYNRLSIDKKTLLKEIMYNADGRNPIYNHTQGVKINNLPTEAYIKWKALGGILEGQIDTDPDFRLITEPRQKRTSAVKEITTAAGIDTIYILPNDDYSGANCNNRVVAEVWKNNGLVATVIVPIYMHLNTFGLASLNAWDGNTVTIDEDGGYVMAPQVGAGEKDGNNRFTGILMGKTETNTGYGEKEKQIGLFGYAHGLQSIFLDAETGNATFGLPDVESEFDDKGNFIGYKTTTNNYSEGRIELRPGDVSSIGGWRIGRRSLFCATNASGHEETINGKTYPAGSVLSDLSSGNENTHEKDIGPQDSGILLSANNIYKENNQNKIGNNPYISLKSRPLIVKNTQDYEGPYDIDNTTGNSPLVNGDSLELQLDPNQSSIFTIYRHYLKQNKETGREEWTRSPLVGINAEGRFYSNALQDEETALNLNYIAAFGEGVIQQKYTGIYIGTSGRTFFKAFVDANEETKISSLRISGSKDGTQDGNSYERPIALYGRDILLYANDNNTSHKLSEQTNSKLIINHSGFVAGNFETNPIPKINEKGEEEEDFDNAIDIASIKLINTGFGDNSQIIVPNNFYLRTKTSIENLGNIYIQTRDGLNETSYSYLDLEHKGTATLQGWTDLNGYANEGSINFRASNKSLLTLSDNITLQSNNGQIDQYARNDKRIYLGLKNSNNKNESTFLNINSKYIQLRTRTAWDSGRKWYSELWLDDGSNGNQNYHGNVYLEAYNDLYLRANNDIYSEATGDAYHLTVGDLNKVTTILNVDTGATWTGAYNHPENGTTAFKVFNSKFGGFGYAVGAKPGYGSNYSTQLGNSFASHSAALVINNSGLNNTNGGFVSNWGYFPGRMFTGTRETSDANYINTSIYAQHRVVSNTGFRTTQDSSSITMKNHTITHTDTRYWGGTTYSSDWSITGDNLYALLDQLLAGIGYAINYAKWSETKAAEAYAYAGQAYQVGNHAHPYASSSHTHALTLDTYTAWTRSTDGHQHQFSYDKPSRVTSGPQ